MGKPKHKHQPANGSVYLDGHVLVAMPNIGDTRFDRAVIYICAHSEEGAMGLIVNQLASNIDISELFAQLDILDEREDGQLPLSARDMQVHRGGPVETGRGFVLHSADYYRDQSTLSIDSEISLTATLDILKAIANGTGPDKALLALGYAGWAPGQLETEIQANGWLHCAADADLIFSEDNEQKYNKALAKIGIDPGMLAVDAGHA
ncbi:MAG: YqgE/AlgH family protein [Hyphomicrobiales bacterium]|nr:YqgE/AlgH family protein [Hyphomicrobiales bacterium]